MPHNEKLADRICETLSSVPKIKVEEKKMFRGVTFMVNGKMCVCVSGEELMCRFDPPCIIFPVYNIPCVM